MCVCVLGSRTLTTTVNKATSSAASSVQLYVGGLRQNQTQDQLQKYFAQYGVVTKCCIWRDRETHMSKGSGVVTFLEMESANRALTDCPHFIDGNPVRLEPFRLRKMEKGQNRRKRRRGKKMSAVTSMAKWVWSFIRTFV